MATISIPNSIGGISIPGGVLQGPLGALFNTKNGQEVTQYPSDLASNPTRAHSVQFTIMDILPTSLTEKKQTSISSTGTAAGSQGVSLGTQAINAVTSAGNAVVNGIQAVPGAIASGVQVAEGAFNSAAKAVQTGTISEGINATLKPPIKYTTDTITLYMPETLNMTYHNQWQGFSMTSALGTTGRIAATASDIFEHKDTDWLDDMKNFAATSGNEILGNLVDRARGPNSQADASMRDVLLRAGGYAINPQTQLMYKGIDLRSFQLDFLFTPKNQSEAKAVKNIIDKFTKASLPKVQGAITGSTSGQYFTMPSAFKIKFQFNGSNNNTAAGAALNAALGNLGSLGGALTNALTGNSSNGNENTYLYKVGMCVLENVSVDYAPNGWAAYTDGSPVQTRLSLSFQEMDIMHRDIYGTNQGQVR
jgi:hypothetical protein